MSSRLPAVKPAQIIRVLERQGFRRTAKKKHRGYSDGIHSVTVPYHAGDLKPKTLRSIIRQAGWTEEEFLEKLRG